LISVSPVIVVLPSFPTRRSSDLAQFYKGAYTSLRNKSANMDVLVALGTSAAYFYSIYLAFEWVNTGSVGYPELYLPIQTLNKYRSEEHTSELQSRFDLVCRLLLE